MTLGTLDGPKKNLFIPICVIFRRLGAFNIKRDASTRLPPLETFYAKPWNVSRGGSLWY